MPLTITREQIAEFAPKAKKAYVDALLANLDVLAGAGILENRFRLCHFMATVGAETAGMALFRESMRYRPARLRAVWPGRFANKTEAYLAGLAADPVLLADAVYGGRMGNKKGTRDGYDFRGGGWIQVTGRANVEALCKDLGIPVTDDVLDNPVITLRMAARFWEKNGCNQWADLNDALKVAKVINTGSATSKVTPVGMAQRQEWLAKAFKVWAEAAQSPLAAVADVQPTELDSRTIADATTMKRIGIGVGVGTGAKAIEAVTATVAVVPPEVPLAEIADHIGLYQRVMEGVSAVSKFVLDHYWVAGVVIGGALWWFGNRAIKRYVEDIRTGKRKAFFKVTDRLVK